MLGLFCSLGVKIGLWYFRFWSCFHLLDPYFGQTPPQLASYNVGPCVWPPHWYLLGQGWPEKDQSGFNHPVLTGLNHLKKPNFDQHKWSKLKNKDFSEVFINKWSTYKKINVNMLCFYVNVISFSTSERSSLFLGQPEGCLNREPQVQNHVIGQLTTVHQWESSIFGALNLWAVLSKCPWIH